MFRYIGAVGLGKIHIAVNALNEPEVVVVIRFRKKEIRLQLKQCRLWLVLFDTNTKTASQRNKNCKKEPIFIWNSI